MPSVFGEAEAHAGREAASRVDADRLMGRLRELPTARAARGDEASRRGLRRTEEVIASWLREGWRAPAFEAIRPEGDMGKDPALALGPGVEPGAAPAPWRNIVVEWRGTDHAGEVLILGAHFDAVPGSPGADDNGSGTAALLEAARVFGSLHAEGWTTRRTIRLVFFNLEEVGMVGSTAHLREFTARNTPPRDGPAGGAPAGERIVGMGSLEMLGFYADGPGSQKSPFPRIEGVFDPPTVGDSIVLVALGKHRAFARRLERAMGASCPEARVFVVDFSPLPLPDLLRSDHAPFALAGANACMLTDTANFRNPNYHKASDTVETIDAGRFTATTRAVVGAWWMLADPVPPPVGDDQHPRSNAPRK